MFKVSFSACFGILFLSSCSQNMHLTLNKSSGISTTTSLSLKSSSSFQYTYDQYNSIPDLSWQITDNTTGQPYTGELEYEYAIGTTPINTLSEFSNTNSSTENIKNWQNTGSNLPFLGAGVEGLSPGIYYINLKAFIPTSHLLVATDFVRFEVLATGSNHPAITLLSPSAGAAAQASSNITLTGTCAPNDASISISGSALSTTYTGTCHDGVFSIPVTLSSALTAASQPQIEMNINNNLSEASASIALNIPAATAPLLAILGPNTTTYYNPIGMGANSPQQEFLLSCAPGDSINLYGEIDNISPPLPATCPTNGQLSFSFDYANNATTDATGSRLVQVSAENLSTGLSTFDSVSFYRSALSPSISSPTSLATVGLLNTASGNCSPGSTIEISNSNLVSNPSIGTCDENGTFSIEFSFLSNSSGAQSISLVQKDSLGISSTSSTRILNVDSTAPTVSFSVASNPINSSPIEITVTLSEALSGLTGDDFTLSNGSLNNFQSTSNPLIYTLSVTPTNNGNVVINLPSGKATDNLGNPNAEAAQLSIEYDNTQPTLLLTGAPSGASNVRTHTITLTPSEPILSSSISLDSFSVSNGTLSNLICAPVNEFTSCTVDVEATAEGELSVKINADKINDLASNKNLESNNLTWNYDVSLPTISLTSNTENNALTNKEIVVTLTFNKAVTGLALSDFNITNGGDTPELAGGPSIYTLTLTPSNQGEVSVQLNENTVSDSAGNQNTASNTLNWTFDSTKPTFSLSGIATETTSQQTLTLTLSFSEEMLASSLTLDAITNALSGDASPTASNLICTPSLAPTECTVDITAAAAGSVNINFSPDTFSDLAGNLNSNSTSSSWTYEAAAQKSCVISQQTTSANATIETTEAISTTGNPLTWIHSGTCIGESTLYSQTLLNTNTYSVTFLSGADFSSCPGYGGDVAASESFTIRIALASGDFAECSSPITYYSPASPDPSIQVEQAATQADPMTQLISALNPIYFDVTFSEAIPGTISPSQITQNGTAPDVQWDVEKKDSSHFIIKAIAASGPGTIYPVISGATISTFFHSQCQDSYGNDPSVDYNPIITPQISLSFPGSSPNSAIPNPQFKISTFGNFKSGDSCSLFQSGDCTGSSVSTFQVDNSTTTNIYLSDPTNLTSGISYNYSVSCNNLCSTYSVEYTYSGPGISALTSGCWNNFNRTVYNKPLVNTENTNDECNSLDDIASPSFATGNGSVEYPFRVCTADQFKAMNNSNYILGRDIDLAGDSVNIFLGTSGSLNGNHHRVTNVNVSSGFLNQGYVENLILKNLEGGTNNLYYGLFKDNNDLVYVNNVVIDSFSGSNTSASTLAGPGCMNQVEISNSTICGEPAALWGGVMGILGTENNYTNMQVTNSYAGSCSINGCTDPGATNYNPTATHDDGSCQYDIYGCTDPGATNYNSTATIEDGSCQYGGSISVSDVNVIIYPSGDGSISFGYTLNGSATTPSTWIYVTSGGAFAGTNGTYCADNICTMYLASWSGSGFIRWSLRDDAGHSSNEFTINYELGTDTPATNASSLNWAEGSTVETDQWVPLTAQWTPGTGDHQIVFFSMDENCQTDNGTSDPLDMSTGSAPFGANPGWAHSFRVKTYGVGGDVVESECSPPIQIIYPQ